MRWMRPLGTWGLLSLGLACSSSPPPEPAVAAEAPKAQTQAVEQFESGPVESVAAPKELFGVARINHPALVADLVSQWMNVPLPIKAVLQKELPELHELVRYDAPVDFAMALDPEAFSEPKFVAALSVPVADYQTALDKLRSGGHALERLSRTMQLVMLNGNQPCVVARANGPTTARFICSDSRKDLDVLAPYMATTMPSENFGDDQVFVELRAEPVRERFGKKAGWLKVGVPVFLRELATGNARLDGAVADATRAVVNELLALISDVDRLILRSKATAARDALDVHLGLVMAGQKSWSAQTLALRAAESAAPPALFWQLPDDVYRATYTAGTNHPERLDPLVEGLAELLEGALEHYDLRSKAMLDVANKLRKVGEVRGSWITAEGPLGANATREQTLASAVGFGGYSIVAGADEEGAVADLYVALAEAFNDASWRNTAQKHPDLEDLAELPRLKKRAAPASMGLPAGSILYQLDLPGELSQALLSNAKRPAAEQKAAKAAPIRLSFIVAKKDGTSWIGAGADEELLANKLSVAIANKAPNLSANVALAGLRTQSAISAGFLTLSGVVDRFAQYAGGAEDPAAKRQQFLLAMPNGGKTPILVSMTGSTRGPELWLSMHLPRAAMEDAAAGAVAVAAEVGGKF